MILNILCDDTEHFFYVMLSLAIGECCYLRYNKNLHMFELYCNTYYKFMSFCTHENMNKEDNIYKQRNANINDTQKVLFSGVFSSEASL